VKRIWIICWIFLLLSGVIWGQTAEEIEALVLRASSLYEQGEYKQAFPLAELALKASLSVHGEENLVTSSCALMLARTYEALNDYNSAELYYKMSLSIDERVLGPDHPDTTTTLYDLAGLYQSTGNYQEALPLYERALAISEEAQGLDHPETAVILDSLGELYRSMGDYQAALPPYERALAIYEKTLGPEHPRTAISLNNLGTLYEAMEEYQAALPLYQRALAINEASGPESPFTAMSLNNLATLYKSMGSYESALPLYKRALAIREEVFGPEHPETATSLNSLARLYDLTGEYQAALPLYKRTLAINEKTSGPEHPYTAASLNDLAELYKSMGEYEVALPLFKRASVITEHVLGSEHPDTATSLNNLAGLYRAMGDYQAALPLYQRALAISEKASGAEHPETATFLNNLAVIYVSMGDYRTSMPLHKRALRIREDVLGPEDPRTATSLNNLATLYREMGDYQAALPLYQRALAISEKASGPEHPFTAASLNNLAELYKAMGDYQAALPIYKRALAIYEKTLGPEHPDTATSFNNLALLYVSMGDYEAALPLCERALAIYEKASGFEDPDSARSLNNLAMLYQSMNYDEAALQIYKWALAVYEKTAGPEDPRTAAILNNLAAAYWTMEDYQQALPLSKRALAIREKVLGPEHPDTAESLDNLAQIYSWMGNYQAALPLSKRALAIREKASRVEQLEVAVNLQNLAYLCIDSGTNEEALRLARQEARATLAATANIFTFASERQRLAYQENLKPYGLFGTLGSASDLSQAALSYKGLVLDSVVEDLRLAEASEDATTRALAEQAKSVKSQLNKIAFDSPTDLTDEAKEENRAREAQLRAELEELQSQLARKGVEQGNLRRAFTITPEQVQSAMPSDSVLVEFLRYRHYLGKNEWQTRYGAVVLPKQGGAIWAPIPGKAEDLEALIADYKKLVRGQAVTRQVTLEVLPESSNDDQVSASQLLTELYEKVWAPVERALPADTKIVIVSPDGELNFMSFATLIAPDDRFLAEKHFLTFVSSGRDLVADKSGTASKEALLVGDPAFGGDVPEQGSRSAVDRAVDTRDWQRMSFAQLPFTRAECVGLEAFFNGQNKQVSSLLGENATEEKVRAMEAPETLHLATHGYFLPEPEANKKAKEEARKPGGQESNLALKDPMFRSGLALAGAQTTVKLRAQGNSPDFRNDGLLTAAEVGVLNLKGTRLVTLSACDTGSGESRAGEGVLGLRRGFVQAGARNLIMTLWPVSDKETSELMQEFYTRADTQPAPLAMAEVQRDWLVRLRKEQSVADAVRLAGPFVLTFQGELE
jgi:tetratricopeptide (TPR) repeat protein